MCLCLQGFLYYADKANAGMANWFVLKEEKWYMMEDTAAKTKRVQNKRPPMCKGS